MPVRRPRATNVTDSRAGDVVICEAGEAGSCSDLGRAIAGHESCRCDSSRASGPKLYDRFVVHRLIGRSHSGRMRDCRHRRDDQACSPGKISRDYEFPLPPLAEQRRIAEVLDRAEALRAKRRAALAQLDSLTQSLFLDLFGDPATNPKGWPMKPLAQAGRRRRHNSSTVSCNPVMTLDEGCSACDIVYGDLDCREVSARQTLKTNRSVNRGGYKRSRLRE